MISAKQTTLALLAAIAEADTLEQAIARAKRDQALLLAPDFLPALVAFLESPPLLQNRLQIAHSAISPVLNDLAPQQLGAPGLALVLVLEQKSAAEFLRRYFVVLDAEFCDFVTSLVEMVKAQTNYDPDVASWFVKGVTLARDKIAFLWAKTMLGFAAPDLQNQQPQDFLDAVVRRAKGNLPEHVARLAAMSRFYAQTANTNLCAAAFCAWVFDASIKLVAELPTAETEYLVDVLRYKGGLLLKKWLDDAFASGRSAVGRRFAFFARWLAWGPLDQELPAPYKSLLDLVGAAEQQRIDLLQNEPWLLSQAAEIAIAGQQSELGVWLARRRECLLRPDQNPLLNLVERLASGASTIKQIKTELAQRDDIEPAHLAAINAALPELASAKPRQAKALAELNYAAAEKLGHKLLLAYSAIALAEQADGQKAGKKMRLLEQALQIGLAERHPLIQAQALAAQARLYAAREDWAQAKRCYLACYRATFAFAPEFGRTEPLLGLVEALLNNGEQTQAALYLDLARHYDVEQQANTATRFNLLRADLLWQRGDAAAAELCWTEAAKQAKQAGDPVLLELIGAHKLAARRPNEALQRLQQGASIAEQRGEINRALDLRFQALALLYALGRDLDFFSEYANYQQLLDQTDASGKEAKNLFLRGRLLLKLNRPLLAAQALRAAYEKARRQNDHDLAQALAPDLAAAHFALHEPALAATILRETSSLASSPNSKGSYGANIPGLGRLEDEVRRIERERLKAAGAHTGRPLNLDGIRTLLAEMPDTALIYLEARAGASLAIIVDQNHAEALGLPLTLDDVTGWLSQLREEAPRANTFNFNQHNFALALEATLQALGALVWDHLHQRLQALGSANLILVPDPLLALLPLHAAPIGRTSVLEQYCVSYATSATLLAASHYQAAAPTSDQIGGWLGVVGSAFADPPLASAVALAKLQQEFGPGDVFWSEQIELAALRGKLSNLDLLHVHLHGRFEPGAGDNGATLSLAMGAKRQARLTNAPLPPELLQNTKLVALAICEGGESMARLTPDMAGLPAALINSGAATVIASPWRLSEPATSLLLNHFYQLLAAGETIAEALRQAQLWLRDLSRQQAATKLRELAAATRRAAIKPQREAAASGRLFEELADNLLAEGAFITTCLHSGGQSEENDSAKFRQLIHNEQSLFNQAHGLFPTGANQQLAAETLDGLLERPYAAPFYWGQLQVIGAGHIALAVRTAQAGSK